MQGVDSGVDMGEGEVPFRGVRGPLPFFLSVTDLGRRVGTCGGRRNPVVVWKVGYFGKKRTNDCRRGLSGSHIHFPIFTGLPMSNKNRTDGDGAGFVSCVGL